MMTTSRYNRKQIILLPEKMFPLRKKPTTEIENIQDVLNWFKEQSKKRTLTELERTKILNLNKNLKFILDKLRDDYIYYWKPNPAQMKFVRTVCYGRVMRGGNRMGKTECIFYDYILRCLGIHPAQREGLYPMPPVFMRITVPDFTTVKSKAEPLARELIPPYELDRYDGESYIFHIKGGSLFELKSNEQPALKHASVDRHRVAFDEPCRHDLFGENLARVSTHEVGGFDIVQTPQWNDLEPWLRTELLPQTRQFPEVGESGITEIRGNWEDNRENISEIGIKQMLSNLTDAERRVRETGEFPEGSSLLFGDMFEDGVHSCRPFLVPQVRLKFAAMDLGIGCPTVHLWAFIGDYSDLARCNKVNDDRKFKAIVTDPVLFIYREYWARGRTIPENASEIKRLSGNERVELRFIDPKSGSKRDEQTGLTRQRQWADMGIYSKYGATNVESGLNAVASLMLYGKSDPQKKTHPKLVIFSNCQNTIKELKKSSVNDLKRTDALHCISCLRWLCSAKLLENWTGSNVHIPGAIYGKSNTRDFLQKRRAMLPRRV